MFLKFLTRLLLTVCCLTTATWAVQPQRFINNSEADFSKGETQDTIVTNLGDVKLASDITTLADMPEDVSILFDTARMSDGTLYLAAGPEAKLLERKDDELTEVLSLEGEQIFTLAQHNGELLVGVSSEKNSRIAALRNGALETVVELPEVRYIWQLLPIKQDDQAVLFVAVGTPGKVLRIALADDPPKIATWLDVSQDNVLCMAQHEDKLYAGTDKDGLVYRLPLTAANNRDDENANTPQPYVVYDAAEPEIAALIVAPNGTVYIGTADAEQARPGRMEDAVEEAEGRLVSPGKPADSAPEDPQDPDTPEAPEVPDMPEIPGEAPQPDPVDGEAGDVVDATGATEADANAVEAGEPATVADEMTEPAEEADTDQGRITSEQRDRLRDLLKAKLVEARESGRLQTNVRGQRGGGNAMNRQRGNNNRPRPVAQKAQKKQGNAVYRVDSDGFVAEVFRESVMILDLALVRDNTKLIIATGNEGQIYQLDIANEESAILTDVEGQQVTTIIEDSNNAIIFGTANPAALIRMTDAYATTGTFISESFDAQQISLFGMIDLNLSMPEGTSVMVQTRSGNVADPEMAPWSDWTEPVTFSPDDGVSPLAPRSTKVQSSPARFLQYKLTLKGNDRATPVVDKAEMTYVMPNLKPVIESVRGEYPSRNARNQQQNELPPPPTVMDIEWQATDANQDRLIFTLQYQPGGAKKWLSIAEDLQENRFEWQTQRVPDGRYLIRVTASDRLDNPPDMAKSTVRQSDPVVVDNTPPTLDKVNKTLENKTLTLTGVANDALLPIGGIAYVLNDQESYTQVLPNDLIFDSTSEAFTVKIAGLAQGSHVLTIRVIDTRGNARYESILFEIE